MTGDRIRADRFRLYRDHVDPEYQRWGRGSRSAGSSVATGHAAVHRWVFGSILRRGEGLSCQGVFPCSSVFFDAGCLS
jgi:hypothetical protein